MQPNLFSEYVASPRRRKKYYLGMLSYLGGCGILLVVVFHFGTLQLVDTFHERREIQRLETSFRRLYPGVQGRLTEAAAAAEGSLKQTQQRLQDVQVILGRRIGIPSILAGVHLPLPVEVQVVRLDIDRARGVLELDLAMPDVTGDEVLDAGHLMEAWNAQPLLQKEVKDLRIVTRNTQRAGDRTVVVMRVEGTLATGKGT